MDMILLLLQEEEKVAAAQEDHLAILATLDARRCTICATSLPLVEVQSLGEGRARKGT
jgi:selenocysteine-specific translation elongation factor